MKSRHIITVVVILTFMTFYFIFDNVFSIWEQASYTRFRPVTTGLPSAQIFRDVQVGDSTADFYVAPAGSARRPLLVVIHGGFLQGGNKKNYAYLGGLGVRQGFVVAVLQLPHFPGIFSRAFVSAETMRARALPEQARRFARFVTSVRTLADRFHFDATKLHVMAHASGALLIGEADLTQFKSLTLVSPLLSLKDNVAQIAPMQLRAIAGFITDADAIKLSPAEWLPKTKMPVFLLCTERDLPYIKDACKQLPLTRPGAPAIERVVVEKPSHFELLFHLGSKIEEATEPLKKFWFNAARL
jgi:arylformamidase